MLKMTLLATTSLSAALFAVAAVLPAIAKSRGGATTTAPVSAAPNDGGQSRKVERLAATRHDARQASEPKKQRDRDHD